LITIRHADPARDGAACAAVYAPFVRDAAISFEERPPTAADFSERIGRISSSFPWLVAEEDGAVIGYAYASAHRDRAAYRWAADVAVYIAPGNHRRGIGRTLYGALFPLLQRQGIRVLCAGVTLPNEGSVGLHEALGFEPVGVYRRIGFKQGSWHDVGWWQLELAPATDESPPEPGAPVLLEEG
jgi:phosphinothricin acetyltransferase